MNIKKEKSMSFNKKENEKLKNLKALLNRKKEDFIKNIFPKYSYSKKVSFMMDKNISNFNYMDMMVILFGFLVMLSSLFVIDISLIIFFCVAILGGAIMLSTHTLIIKKFTSMLWFTEDENLNFLASEMFVDSAVDKELLKHFIETYGEEEFVNIMLGKECLTYKDFQLYIDTKSKKEKEKLILSETAKCLLQ